MTAASISQSLLPRCQSIGKAPMCSARPVACKAEADRMNPVPRVSKRGTLLGLGMASVLAVDSINPSMSWALLPDDDDADLVQKAKASRQRKLQEELATEKKYRSAAGFGSKNDKKILAPVQKAVFELARAGSQLESDNLSALASSATGKWVGDFKTASGKISSGIAGAEKSVESVYTGIDALAAFAQQGDAKGSKKAYVYTIEAFQYWASAAGVAGSLKGL